MSEVLFIKPYLIEKVWGGSKLKDCFGYNTESSNIGECLAISAHKSGDCEVLNGEYKGNTLSKLYKENPEIFGGDTKEEFPLLVKIIDAKDDLSIQVHPDDAYSRKFENQYGKTECWYVLECVDGADIVVGHNANNNDEARTLIEQEKWDEFLHISEIKEGYCFLVKPGTVHAIRKGTVVYELQQSSDVTYRLYDYNRLEKGKLRELHIDKSLDVITSPQRIKGEHTDTSLEILELIRCEFFGLTRINNTEKRVYNINAKYLMVTVVDGIGTINSCEIRKGDSFIVTSGNTSFELDGKLTIMVAYE